jgi:MFS family permease
MFASNVGTWMQTVLLPAYIDARTGSATTVGYLVFAQLGPMLLLSIPAGVIADKVPRRPWIIATQLLQLVATVVVAGIVGADGPIVALFFAQLVIGIGNALGAPAFQASVPLLVNREDLPGAIVLNSFMINGSRVLGPAVAALLGAVGLATPGILLVNAATYLFVVAALTRIPVPDVRGQHPERGWRRALTGVNIARRRPVLARMLVTMFSFSLFCLVFVGLFASVARLNFGVDPLSSTYKWLYATWGLGACTGALSVGTVFATTDKRRVLAGGLVGFAASLLTFALVRSAGPAFPVGFALGTCYFLVATTLVTVLQVNLHDTERAAVMPLWFMAFGGTVTLGNLAFAPVVDAIGARWVLAGGAAFAVILAWWSDLRRLGRDAFLDQEAPAPPQVAFDTDDA